jgi:hypothetical protein
MLHRWFGRLQLIKIAPPWKRIILACGLLLAVGCFGCVARLDRYPRFVAIGVVESQDHPIIDAVRFRQVDGVGVLFGDFGNHVGYFSFRSVVARIENESYDVETPMGRIAVGEAANEAARCFPSLKPGGSHCESSFTLGAMH